MSESNRDKYRILFAEDLPTDVELAKREISKEGIKFDHRVVDTEEAFREELDNFKPDIVVSDYSMPTFDGMSALHITREHEHYFPFIVLTGSMNEETAVACMKAGANDYVIKEQIKRLPFAILEAIENNKSRIEKARIENQLILSEQRFRLLFNQVPNIAIQGYNEKGIIHYWNHASEKMFGYTEQEAMGKSILELIFPEKLKKDFREIIHKMFMGDKPYPSEELQLEKKDGTTLPALVNQVIVKLFGEMKEMYSIIIDLTERNMMINDLVEAKNRAEESDRLKSAFLMNMSHEIRTPMNGILGFTDLLTRPQLTGEQKEQYIEIIQSSGQRMLSTVNDIIEISRIESGEVVVTDDHVRVNDVLRELTDFFSNEAEKKGLRLQCHCLNKDEIIVADQNKLQSILSNLIKNAIKFTEKGSVTVRCMRVEGMLQFSVADTGIGIPKERQKAVFNRFEQADIADKQAYQGSGLGLSIADSYVNMLDGKIWIESEEGAGATFYFTIPDRKNSIQGRENSLAETENNLRMKKKLKILIAEDEEAAVFYLSIILESISEEVLYAKNGKEALELLRQNDDIDLVLMDIKMPGMDGYEATRRIREFNKNIVIIAQTAYAIIGDKDKALNAGCNDYITKPIDDDALLAMIDKHFS